MEPPEVVEPPGDLLPTSTDDDSPPNTTISADAASPAEEGSVKQLRRRLTETLGVENQGCSSAS